MRTFRKWSSKVRANGSKWTAAWRARYRSAREICNEVARDCNVCGVFPPIYPLKKENGESGDRGTEEGNLLAWATQEIESHRDIEQKRQKYRIFLLRSFEKYFRTMLPSCSLYEIRFSMRIISISSARGVLRNMRISGPVQITFLH